MKVLGALLFVAAVIALLLGFNLDTSIETVGGRINNLGLMKDQQNIIILGGALLIAGALLLSLSGREKTNDSTTRKVGFRKCPNCAEFVRDEAKSCRYCQHVLPSMAEVQAQIKADQARLAEAKRASDEAAEDFEKSLPKGLCPRCDEEIPLIALECKHCHALFGENATWSVLPLPSDRQ